MSAGKKLDRILAGAVRKKQASPEPKGRLGNHQGSRGQGGRTPGVFARLERLYADMEQAYRVCAEAAGLSCEGCLTNCCTSFFQHHTYVEWAYLWRGLREMEDKRRKEFAARAELYVREARQSLARNMLPDAMCPLNEGGLCATYPHRLMICRLHGTRNSFALPDGRKQFFPGCVKFAELPCARSAQEDDNADGDGCPTLDRTSFYRELAALEMEFQKKAARPLPRVNLTIAEMIVMGPPTLR